MSMKTCSACKRTLDVANKVIHHYYYVSDNSDARRYKSYTVMTPTEHAEWHNSHPTWKGVILMRGDDAQHA